MKLPDFEVLLDPMFWIGILAVIGFVWCITSFGKFVGKLIELIR